MATRPFPSTVMVNSDLHRSQSQKYSTALFFTGALPCSEPGEDRCRSTRNNFPLRRYWKDAPHEGFAHLVTINISLSITSIPDGCGRQNEFRTTIR